jgi:organic hydroperoxide reductase OsmC/OhrA
MGIYKTNVIGNLESVELNLTSPNKSPLIITPPPEFKGPDGEWTPEDLFSAAISSCYLLTFKALSKYKKMPWENLDVTAEAKLEKTPGGLKFTEVIIYPKLKVSKDTKIEPYIKLLDEAEKNCLVSKSMNCEFQVKPKIIL